MAVDDPGPAPGRLDHAVEEGDEQAVRALGQRLLAALALLPGQAVAEGQEDGQVGISLLERGHHLAGRGGGPGRRTRPRAPAGVALLAVVEELPLVLLGVEQDARAPARRGRARRPAGRWRSPRSGRRTSRGRRASC